MSVIAGGSDATARLRLRKKSEGASKDVVCIVRKTCYSSSFLISTWGIISSESASRPSIETGLRPVAFLPDNRQVTGGWGSHIPHFGTDGRPWGTRPRIAMRCQQTLFRVLRSNVICRQQPATVKRSETSLFNGDGRGVQQNFNEML